MLLPRLIVLAATVCLVASAYCLFVDEQPTGIIFLAAGAALALTMAWLFFITVRHGWTKAEPRLYCPNGHPLPRDNEILVFSPWVTEGKKITVYYESCPTCLRLREIASGGQDTAKD